MAVTVCLVPSSVNVPAPSTTSVGSTFAVILSVASAVSVVSSCLVARIWMVSVPTSVRLGAVALQVLPPSVEYSTV